MEIALFIVYVIIVIILAIIIKDFYNKQQDGLIIIYRNNYDLFLNAFVYILPALVFFIEKPGFNNKMCYFCLCIGFTIVLCISACDSNKNIVDKITASIIKIITGIEVPLAIILILLILAILNVGKKVKRY